MALNQQASELNALIEKQNPSVFSMLSKRGKAIFFPRKGILAQGAAASGKEINGTIGTAYEDDGKPMVLPSFASQLQLDTKNAFPYAPSEGLRPLREKWLELMKIKNPSLGDKVIGTPLVTCGVTNALSMVGYMFAEDTDKIIIADLYWENYDLVFTNAYGAELEFFNFFKNKVFDIESFERAVNASGAEKKIVLLNFPNNPSGYTPTKQAGGQIIDVLKKAAENGNKLIVILDDSYFGLDFEDDIYSESLFAELAGANENLLAIKVDGLTKEEYAWGFRVGFITYGVKNGTPELYKALEDKTAGAVRGNISNASHPAQSLFLNAVKSPTRQEEKTANKQKMLARYLKVKEVLSAHPEYAQYFEELPFNSGYFMCVKLKDNLNAEKVWELLLNKFSTGVICYGEKNLFRLAFASTPTNKIEKMFNNIYSACKECAG